MKRRLKKNLAVAHMNDDEQRFYKEKCKEMCKF